jgi:hypothetical protein
MHTEMETRWNGMIAVVYSKIIQGGRDRGWLEETS